MQSIPTTTDVVEQLACDRGLWRQIVRRVGEENLAEDVLQQVLLTVHKKLGQLRDFSKLRPWVFQIMRNEATKLMWQRRHFTSWENSQPELLAPVKSQETDPVEIRSLLLHSLMADVFSKTEKPVAQMLIEETIAGVGYKIVLQKICSTFCHDANYATTLISRIRRKLDGYLQQQGYDSFLRKKEVCNRRRSTNDANHQAAEAR